jgi:hypothetical protein
MMRFDEPIFGENTTTVAVDDEAAGPFLVIKQCGDNGDHSISLDFDEIGTLYQVMKRLRDEWEQKK